MRPRSLCMTLGLLLAMAPSALRADFSPQAALHKGKKEINKILAQAYYDPIEFDTVVILPVHSRLAAKGNFYLLYFLKKNKFQAELMVTKKNGEVSLISCGKVSPPYFPTMSGDFNYKYVTPDSIIADGTRRIRMKPDSVRAVYLGVNSLLGKRGVIWELFTGSDIYYVSIGANSVDVKSLYREINTSPRPNGNFVADSINGAELIDRVKRIGQFGPDKLRQFKLNTKSVDSLVVAFTAAKDSIYLRFPELRGKLEPPLPRDTTRGH